MIVEYLEVEEITLTLPVEPLEWGVSLIFYTTLTQHIPESPSWCLWVYLLSASQLAIRPIWVSEWSGTQPQILE